MLFILFVTFLKLAVLWSTIFCCDMITGITGEEDKHLISFIRLVGLLGILWVLIKLIFI